MFLNFDFINFQTLSIRFKLGQYGGRNTIVMFSSCANAHTLSAWWYLALSFIITISFQSGYSFLISLSSALAISWSQLSSVTIDVNFVGLTTLIAHNTVILLLHVLEGKNIVQSFHRGCQHLPLIVLCILWVGSANNKCISFLCADSSKGLNLFSIKSFWTFSSGQFHGINPVFLYENQSFF